MTVVMIALFAFFGFFFLSTTNNFDREMPELLLNWFILAVMYVGLFFVFKSRPK